MVLETHFYTLLGVSPTADDDEIKRNYRKLAKQYHPDKNPDEPEKFKEISMVYDVLTDPRKRKIYDDQGEKGIKGARSDSDDEEGGTCTCCCAAAAAANAAAAGVDPNFDMPFGFRFNPGAAFYESFIFSRMGFYVRPGGTFEEDEEVDLTISESEDEDDEIDDDEEEEDEEDSDEGVHVSEAPVQDSEEKDEFSGDSGDSVLHELHSDEKDSEDISKPPKPDQTSMSSDSNSNEPRDEPPRIQAGKRKPIYVNVPLSQKKFREMKDYE